MLVREEAAIHPREEAALPEHQATQALDQQAVSFLSRIIRIATLRAGVCLNTFFSDSSLFISLLPPWWGIISCMVSGHFGSRLGRIDSTLAVFLPFGILSRRHSSPKRTVVLAFGSVLKRRSRSLHLLFGFSIHILVYHIFGVFWI